MADGWNPALFPSADPQWDWTGLSFSPHRRGGPLSLDWASIFPSTLPSRQTVPATGLPIGPAPTVQGAEPGPDWGNIAGAAAPFLFSLLGSNRAKGQAGQSTDQLAQLAKAFGTQGQQLAGQGQAALAPVIAYLQALVGGDPQALNQATQPERARVLDQYDTARKALQFLPRGGGQAGAVMQAGSRAAGDIGSIIGGARQGAANTLGTLGQNLTQQGLGLETAGANALANVIQEYQRQSEVQGFSLANLGAMIGKALPLILGAL